MLDLKMSFNVSMSYSQFKVHLRIYFPHFLFGLVSLVPLTHFFSKSFFGWIQYNRIQTVV